METLSYNRLIPMGMDKSLVDSQVISSLEQIGYDIGADEINLAKIRLFWRPPIRCGPGAGCALPALTRCGNFW